MQHATGSDSGLPMAHCWPAMAWHLHSACFVGPVPPLHRWVLTVCTDASCWKCTKRSSIFSATAVLEGNACTMINGNTCQCGNEAKSAVNVTACNHETSVENGENATWLRFELCFLSKS
jgi:hypothetical protein